MRDSMAARASLAEWIDLPLLLDRARRSSGRLIVRASSITSAHHGQAVDTHIARFAGYSQSPGSATPERSGYPVGNKLCSGTSRWSLSRPSSCSPSCRTSANSPDRARCC
jgi:hypothetical protein